MSEALSQFGQQNPQREALTGVAAFGGVSYVAAGVGIKAVIAGYQAISSSAHAKYIPIAIQEGGNFIESMLFDGPSDSWGGIAGDVVKQVGGNIIDNINTVKDFINGLFGDE